MLAIEYFKNKKENPIYKNLISHIYIENNNDIFYLSQSLKNNIYIEKIIFNENLKNILRTKFNIELEKFHYRKDKYIQTNLFNNIIFNELQNIIKTEINFLLIILFKNEILQYNDIIKNNNININSVNNCIFLYDNETNCKLIVNDISIIIIISNCIIFCIDTSYLILSKELCIFSYNNILSFFKLKEDSQVIYGFIKILTNYKIPINKNLPKIKSNTLLSIKYNNNKIYVKEKYSDNIYKNYSYSEYERNINNDYYKSFTIGRRNNNIYLKKINNNYIKNESLIISECTITDKNTGLRFRGKYEYRENGNENKTILQKNDIIEYHEEDNNILVDTIKNYEINNNEYIIGWKVVKNINGELRIVKLGIDTDVKKIIPIDSDYYLTRGKERCEKAIVLDIQMPYKDQEISVVPNEMESYSCVYNDSLFKYSVGKEVYPDSFDIDENNSCSNGIHYYRDKNILFEMYILE